MLSASSILPAWLCEHEELNVVRETWNLPTGFLALELALAS
jgi:hypothetical protein